jgi:hypothetical protein
MDGPISREPKAQAEGREAIVLGAESRDDVVEGRDFLRRIPAGLFRPIEPERGTSFGREMPANDFARVSVELFLRLFRSG